MGKSENVYVVEPKVLQEDTIFQNLNFALHNL